MATRAPKDHPESSAEGKAAQRAAERADADTADQVQQRVDQETEQGFRGVEVDPTPNENYSVQGVISGKPTPETDRQAAADAREGQHRAEQFVDGDNQR